MFRVILRWDGAETTTSLFNYEYALRALNSLVEGSEKFRPIGFIKEYSVELKKES